VLDLVDDALEAFFRAAVPLGAQDVDVSFEAPEKDWSAKLTRPTVNLFLWDIRRSADRARAGVEELNRDGRLVRRMALPRVELRYLVTAWTSDHGDERALLAGLMRTILGYSEIPAPYLPPTLAALPPMQMMMARSGEDHMDVFKGLEGQLKPGINLIVVSAVDTDVATPVGPPVSTFETRVGFNGTERADAVGNVRRVAGEIVDPAAVGAAVLSPRGTSQVNEAGRFVIRARVGDEIVIETEPPRTAVVPAVGGVRVD